MSPGISKQKKIHVVEHEEDWTWTCTETRFTYIGGRTLRKYWITNAEKPPSLVPPVSHKQNSLTSDIVEVLYMRAERIPSLFTAHRKKKKEKKRINVWIFVHVEGVNRAFSPLPKCIRFASVWCEEPTPKDVERMDIHGGGEDIHFHSSCSKKVEHFGFSFYFLLRRRRQERPCTFNSIYSFGWRGRAQTSPGYFFSVWTSERRFVQNHN